MPVPNAMFTLDGRLASFAVAHQGPKRRNSSRRGSALKGQNALKWPHATPSPAQLARAGFFYTPTASSPDNVTCFLCQRVLDGWEDDDDPIAEHLKHSSECGWAIMASLQQRREIPDGEEQDPLSKDMKDARRVTFADRWPHDEKKGWVCKTEKMVEGGWYYCPTPESDDFVSCPYCSLCLDGWEPKDKPIDEHRRRSPKCPFFSLAKQSTSQKKAARGSRAGRTSNSSRLSTQSNLTAMSIDAPSVTDQAPEDGDSALTTATTVSTASKAGKKGGRTKKAATSTKGRKTRAKSNDVVKVDEEPKEVHVAEAEDGDFDVKVDAQPTATSDAKGRKRKSHEMDIDSVQEPEDASQCEPPAKRKAAKPRAKAAGDGAKAPKRVVSAARKKKEAKPPPPPAPPKQATPSPSPSSQPSDAENQPPSQLSVISPLLSTRMSRTPLATSTPSAMQRNRTTMIGIEPQNGTGWMAADLEAIFLKSPSSRGSDAQDKENLKSWPLNDAIMGVKGTLTSPEKKMTVEEWIKYNAGLGEERLKGECERLTGIFEKEGNRALQALEGIQVAGSR